MAGAEFRRADLHVHTFRDHETDPSPDLQAYLDAAESSGIGVLAITDHNMVRFGRDAVALAADRALLVLPGIEVSTHDGHLLGLFAPDAMEALEQFATSTNLQLKDLSETEKRSTRSMLDLVEEIGGRGGLAIPAHVDAADGMHEKLSPAELTDLLTSDALAGVEFATRDALSEWFTDKDPDQHRRDAWKARQQVSELAERGLARLMSSDAHSIEKVGQDRNSQTLTRLRLDDANFDAVRNAIQFNPKARCKAEAVLPASYPRILSAEFTGGFLDGVTMDFSPNLNCLVGGRGSGKSTALLAIRAALGAEMTPEENPDELDRMPDETRVHFVEAPAASGPLCDAGANSQLSPIPGRPFAFGSRTSDKKSPGAWPVATRRIQRCSCIFWTDSSFAMNTRRGKRTSYGSAPTTQMRFAAPTGTPSRLRSSRKSTSVSTRL